MFATASTGSDGRVLVVTQASVLVYRTTTGQPKRRRTSRTRSAGMLAAPMAAMRIDETSISSKRGCRSISSHCVGTPCPTVTRSRSNSTSESSARQFGGVMMQAMPLEISSQRRVM